MISLKAKSGLLALCMVSLFMTGCSTMDSPEGTYTGSVYSAGVVPVLTTFYPQPPDEKKQMYGIFMYQENNFWVTGSLSHCRPGSERQIICQWHDKYGSGVMDVRFDERYESFDGNWGTYCGTRSDLIWNGKRTQPTPDVKQ
jgi:hypothetical protein